jgi:hypothetical protein
MYILGLIADYCAVPPRPGHEDPRMRAITENFRGEREAFKNLQSLASTNQLFANIVLPQKSPTTPTAPHVSLKSYATIRPYHE